jgi:hypothetical protein
LTDSSVKRYKANLARLDHVPRKLSNTPKLSTSVPSEKKASLAQMAADWVTTAAAAGTCLVAGAAIGASLTSSLRNPQRTPPSLVSCASSMAVSKFGNSPPEVTLRTRSSQQESQSGRFHESGTQSGRSLKPRIRQPLW